MGYSYCWLHMADKEIKVHRRVIRMILSHESNGMNDCPMHSACLFYDNGKMWRVPDHCLFIYFARDSHSHNGAKLVPMTVTSLRH